MKEELYAKITGRVQGVFFRAETAERARSLGLTGWVRNTPDGWVELVVQGKRKQLEEFLEWCKKGPPRAEVKSIEIKWQESKEGFKEFEIYY